MNPSKNFSYDSLHFLVWRESDKSLTLLAKDYEPTQVFAAGLISRGGAMAFVCHDDRQNLKFFQCSGLARPVLMQKQIVFAQNTGFVYNSVRHGPNIIKISCSSKISAGLGSIFT